MKKILLATVIAATLSLATKTANAGWPVLDATNLTQAILEFQQLQKEYQNAVDQYNTLKDSYDTLKDQYNTLQDVKSAVQGQLNLGQMLDISSLYAEFLGNSMSEADYANSLIERYISDYYSQEDINEGHKLMIAEGIDPDSLDLSVKTETERKYAAEYCGIKAVRKFNTVMEKQYDNLKAAYTKLGSCPDLKCSQALLDEIEQNKQVFEVGQMITQRELQLAKDKSERHQHQLENKVSAFVFECKAADLKSSLRNYH